ncbi:MAG: LysM peptidoglycan-binding domain-containing protein, partial [Nevskiales bacterium]
LPAVESAYDPNAYSPSHAVGLWQFLPGTGARFGLRRNWWYDGRRDVTESTRAALDYLSYLHDMFNDWPLALAAYNSGEGRVQQALQSNRARGLPEDFWSISLPAETRDYVPRLLGLAELLAKPEQYGYELAPLSNEPRFEIVELPGQIELQLAAGLIDLDPEILQQLNPGFSRWATDPQGPHRLLVPQGQGERLRQAIAVLPATGLVRWHQYVAEEGDNLPDIARRYGVQTALLQQVNNLSGNQLMSGTELRIPRAFARAVPLPQQRSRSTRLTSLTYIIRPGDSLWRIAQQHGVRVNDLLRWNNLSRSATLRPGRKLVIRGDDKTTDT